MSTDFDYTDLRAHWHRSGLREKAERLSWATEPMDTARAAYAALLDDGWRPAIYCPKDGSVFLAWHPSKVMPYRCKYEGEWPNGRWLALVNGDLWPDNPVLWKPMPEEDKIRDTPTPQSRVGSQD